MTNDYREPTSLERELFNRLLSVSYPGRDELVEHLASAKVATIDPDGSLAILSSATRIAPVSQRVPVEAQAADADGTPIYALLHVQEGRPFELEIYKADGSNITRMPEPSDFEVCALSGDMRRRRD